MTPSENLETRRVSHRAAIISFMNKQDDGTQRRAAATYELVALPEPDDAGETLRSVFSVVAARANATDLDPRSRDVAARLISAFTTRDRLTYREACQRAGLDPDDAVTDSVFRRLKADGAIAPRLLKAHQPTYSVTLSAVAGRLFAERVQRQGGIGEVIKLLDDFVRDIVAERMTDEQAAAGLEHLCDLFAAAAAETATAAETAPIDELYRKQRGRGPESLYERAELLHQEVVSRFPDLMRAALRMIEHVNDYLDAIRSVLERLRDEGANSRLFSILSAEEYRTAARVSSPEQLADVTSFLMFDAAPDAIEAGHVADAVAASGAPRPSERRPTPPASIETEDALSSALERARRRREQLIARAERFLQGDDQADLTSVMPAIGYTATADLLADLAEMDRRADLPYAVDASDHQMIDADSERLTYWHPTAIRRLSPSSHPDFSPAEASQRGAADG